MLWKHIHHRKRCSVPLGALDRKDRQTKDCGEQFGLDQGIVCAVSRRYRLVTGGGEVCRWAKQEGLKMSK